MQELSGNLVWITPGVPDAEFSSARDNVPVAAGYTLAWLRCNGWAAGLEFTVLDASTASYAGDAALLKAIVDHHPRVACFSCYSWNVERILWLLARLRPRYPDCLLILGGPEINPGSPAWNTPLADALVRGEGETGLPLALAQLSRRRDGPVPLLVQSPLFSGLARLPDPYTTGIIPPGLDRNCFIESVRGCRHRCHYCFYSKSAPGLRHHAASGLASFFRWAAGEGGVQDIYLIDPSFDAQPGLEKRLAELTSWNHSGMALHTETRLEKITPERARAYARCGFRSVEAGLQSIHPRVCREVGRRLDLDAFRQGAAAMKEAGVALEIGIILGLPADDLAGFTATLEWLAEEKLAEETEVFLLSLLPATRLRERAVREGWQFMANPPYSLLAGWKWDEASLLEGIYRVEEILDRGHYLDIPPYLPQLPACRYRTACRVDTGDGQAVERLEQQLPELASVVSFDVFVDDPEKALPVLCRIGDLLRRECPFGIHLLVFHQTAPASPGFYREVRTAFTCTGQYWNRINYFRDDVSGIYSCRLFLRVPSAGWREWIDHLPGEVEPVFELPPRAEEFIRLAGALRNRTDIAGNLYLVSDFDIPRDYRVEIEQEIPRLFSRLIEQPSGGR